MKKLFGNILTKKTLVTSMLCLTLIVSLCVPALAAETTDGGDLNAVLGGMTTITSLVNTIVGMITSNPILVLFFAVGLLGVGIAVFKKLKGASKD